MLCCFFKTLPAPSSKSLLLWVSQGFITSISVTVHLSAPFQLPTMRPSRAASELNVWNITIYYIVGYDMI